MTALRRRYGIPDSLRQAGRTALQQAVPAEPVRATQGRPRGVPEVAL